MFTSILDSCSHSTNVFTQKNSSSLFSCLSKVENWKKKRFAAHYINRSHYSCENLEKVTSKVCFFPHMITCLKLNAANVSLISLSLNSTHDKLRKVLCERRTTMQNWSVKPWKKTYNNFQTSSFVLDATFGKMISASFNSILPNSKAYRKENWEL